MDFGVCLENTRNDFCFIISGHVHCFFYCIVFADSVPVQSDTMSLNLNVCHTLMVSSLLCKPLLACHALGALERPPPPLPPPCVNASELEGAAFLDNYKQTGCALHRLFPCPVCHDQVYLRNRVKRAVSGALKRLGLHKTKSVLCYLGTNSWTPVLEHLENKRAHWNEQHPHAPMTATNCALDHIRPVREFQKEGVGAKTLLCNHFTNLQPLLLEDNSWKGDSWSAKDEEHWHTHIVLRPSYRKIYYPLSAPTQPSLLRHVKKT